MVLETYTGLSFDYDDPRPEMVSLTDIARALSMNTRFLGHVTRFYSIASHALLVRALVVEAGHPELAPAALHHDSHETYLTDIPTPLKQALRQRAPGVLEKMEADIDAAIGEAFGIDPELFHHPVVKQADAAAIVLEAQRLKRSKGTHAGFDKARALAPDPKFPPYYRWGHYRTPAVAESAFLRAHTTTLANATAA